MNNKSLKIPAIVIAIGLILAVASYMLTGILKTPTIAEHDFNYSATYKLNGETKTFEGVYRCRFVSTGGGIDPLDRYYEGEYISNVDGVDAHSPVIDTLDNYQLCLVFIFTSDYLMGDGYFEDEYDDAVLDPYLAVFDEQGCEYTEPEML